MKQRDEVTDEKLRGGFYSPDPLVDLCLDRICTLTREADQTCGSLSRALATAPSFGESPVIVPCEVVR